MSLGSNIGFYSSFQKDDGEILAESQNYLICYRYGDGDLSSLENMKIIRLKDTFSEKTINKMYENIFSDYHHGESLIFPLEKFSIEGTYDGLYLYPEKLTLINERNDKTCEYSSDSGNKVGKNDITNWVGTYELQLSRGDVANYKSHSYKLNMEANSISNKLTSYEYDGNLFTSYMGSTQHLYNDPTISMSYAFVFHPVAIAIGELPLVYFFILVIFGVALMITNILIIKMKELQISYENNRKDLTRSVAHELKTPLGIIKSYSESLKEISNENKVEYINVIINEVNHMDKLILDMLELSRLEAKVRTLNYEEVELVALTKSVLKRFDPVLREQNITLEIDTPEEVIISADLEGMQTVLLNLISNAMKYANSIIKVNIKCDGKSALFNIYNDGNHIVEGMLDKIWDTFVKEDKTRGHLFGSTGIGLSITKNILELHKATYGCENVTKGVEFWFKLKL